MTVVPRLTDDLYHYTSSTVALESILPQVRLRLGLVELMNDPRESRPMYPNLSLADGVEGLGPDHNATMEDVDRQLRRAAKVACFTRDFALPDSVLEPTTLRGYAHPALWAHYASSHTGVALRFSQSALSDRIHTALGPRGLLFERPVEYRTGESRTAIAAGLDVEQIHEFGLDAVVTRYLQRYHEELFFEKHSDWEAEREYRWVFINPEPTPVHVDVSGALTGLVLGDAFPDARLDAVHYLASQLGIEVLRIRFFNRHLHVFPVPSPPDRVSRPHRRRGSLVTRARELEDAELAAEEASAIGKELAAPIAAHLTGLMEQIAAKATMLPGVEVALHKAAAAIPPSDRRRAPGVPTYAADYQDGVMCVVENLPTYSLTFIAAAALQTVGGSQVKLYAAFEMEIWRKDAPNDRLELWRFARAGTPSEREDLATDLVAAMAERLDFALDSFDARRSEVR